MAKKAKIGKKWQKMAQKWQKLAFFIDFSNFCHIWITFRKIFTETSLTPKMKDFVPVFLLKQSFKSYLKPNLQNWLLKMGQISKNRKKLQKNQNVIKSGKISKIPQKLEIIQILSIFGISMDFLNCMINIDQFMAFWSRTEKFAFFLLFIKKTYGKWKTWTYLPWRNSLENWKIGNESQRFFYIMRIIDEN